VDPGVGNALNIVSGVSGEFRDFPVLGKKTTVRNWCCTARNWTGNSTTVHPNRQLVCSQHLAMHKFVRLFGFTQQHEDTG
tara:strand:+ start:212 stop:451 length:240 start_codon:yes stop_codon:yes gene_type:complete